MSHEPAKGVPATVIPGDGIGPEIVDAVVAVLDAVGSPSSDGNTVARRNERGGDPLPKDSIVSDEPPRASKPLRRVGGGFAR